MPSLLPHLGNAVKPEQVQSQISRVLTGAIAGLRDPRVPMIVTVEHVSVTADYGLARVYVSAMTGNQDDLVEALNHARGHLQRQVAEHVRLRRTPTLEFHAAGEGRR